MSFLYNLGLAFTWAGMAARPPHARLAEVEQFGGPWRVLTGESQNAELFAALDREQPVGFVAVRASLAAAPGQ